MIDAEIVGVHFSLFFAFWKYDREARVALPPRRAFEIISPRFRDVNRVEVDHSYVWPSLLFLRARYAVIDDVSVVPMLGMLTYPS